ncbi:MAG: acetate--CoA ligase [Microgenomates group bacterium]|nr:acetate--CoA ligase [Microgenomates group bacterium]
MIINPPQEIDNFFVKDYQKLYNAALDYPEYFWENIAKELYWFKPWRKVLDWQYPYARWFVGAETNIVYNALDRHLKTPTKNKTALIWEGQDGLVRTFTYFELNEAVSRFANALKSLGIRKGDRVAIYLPRVPEQIISMLACAKIGAIHTVIYSGFSIEAVKNRLIDEQAKIVITTNGYYFRDKLINTKNTIDEAVKEVQTVQNIIVVKRLNIETNMVAGRDLWFDEVCHKADNICSTEIMDSNDPLFILYTSGTTGKPKGIIHGHGGYMVGVYITLKWVFNLQPDDIYWCTADPGWITGHSYIVYSPLINGVTSFFYEGPPDFPDPGRWWSLIEKYKITKYYTTPTAIRSLMRYGDEIPNKYDLSSLKILGSVGEPINPEAWLWFYKIIGKEKCPVMDTWWQTETGMHIITPFPSTPLKPGSASKPFPGIIADIVDEKGQSVSPNTQGYLVIKNCWPAMFLDVYNNPQRYKELYWEKIPNVYFTGDSAKIDEEGYFWIIGRNDDVLKVSGYRFGSAELESALVAHPAVAEAAVIGKPDELKGESIKAFVILKIGVTPTDNLKKELREQMRKLIGPIATPDEIEFVNSLPKTRSGKIMRRVLKAQELGQPLGDTSTLES